MAKPSQPDLTVERVPWDTLKAHPDNPRNGDTDAIVESITTTGVYRPIYVAKDGTILAGHHLWYALGELEQPEVDIIRLPYGPRSQQAKRIMLVDNRTADLGNYDDGLLLKVLEELKATELGLQGTGYDLAALAKLDGGGYTDESEEREIDNRDAGTVTPGSRWKVGVHTVHCGDSTDPACWDGCPPVDVILADPPYGIGYEGGPGTKRAKIKDDDSWEQALKVTLDAYAQIPLVSGGLVYTFGGSGAEAIKVAAGLVDAGYARWGLVWVKNLATIGRADYQQQHEMAWMGQAPIVDKPDGQAPEAEQTTLKPTPGLNRKDYRAQHEMLWYGWREGAPHRAVKDRTLTTVFPFDRPHSSKDHPTQKPVPLLTHILLAHELPPDSVVADPFAGSGSAGVAASNLGYTTWQVEQDPAYARVAIARLEEALGVTAEKVTG
ncbi:MAG: ParB N-terminal domain-containing protein [Candidatus Nanopelagicales bacterium]|jgi:DNA modification methylase|nr:ParB N-terminal domain-containing protein [Candidatus Nanopelagicales bacterium]MCU0297321.1 ParB N-terminal domain-containing protein [Candidatus Nanopelagicales bacterium]